MSFALQCGHANQLAFCVSLLTLSLCFMKMPSGSLHFFSERDFWTLCRILGAFYNHLFPAVPSLPGPVPRKWCKAVKWDCAWDPAEGKACQKGHRNFHINRMWPDQIWADGVKGCSSGQGTQTALNAFCSRAVSLPFMQHREMPLTVSPPSLVTMIQCLTINYFTKWGTSLCCIQSRPSAQVWSKPDESTEASSLSHLQSLFFLCWILSTLDSSNVRVPRLSLLSLNLITTNLDSGASFPYFSVASQPVIFNWLVNLSRSSCVNWAEILERPLEIIYYVKKTKTKANSSQLTFDAGEDSVEYQELLLSFGHHCPLFCGCHYIILLPLKKVKKHFLETS